MRFHSLKHPQNGGNRETQTSCGNYSGRVENKVRTVVIFFIFFPSANQTALREDTYTPATQYSNPSLDDMFELGNCCMSCSLGNSIIMLALTYHNLCRPAGGPGCRSNVKAWSAYVC